MVDTYVYPISATIDGIEVANLEEYRTVSSLFNVDPLPYKNLLDVPKDTEGPAVTSGYYLLLPPLSAGDHVIEFEGEIIVPEWQYHFRLDIRYDLTVANDGE